MQVILTPTAVADLFGPGLNGFKGNTPPLPPPTQVSAEWLNAVQMELVNPLLDQGIALDALAFDQLTVALNNWQWSGSPTIKSGATMFVANGGRVRVQAGGELITDAGSTVTFDGDAFVNNLNVNGNTVIGNNALDTVTFTAVAASDLSMGGFNVQGVGRLILNTGVSPLNAGQLTAGAGGVLRYQPAGTAHYVHTTQQGYVFDFEMGADLPGLIGASAEICDCNINAPVIGKVLVTATFVWDPDTDVDTITVFLRDDTAASTILTRVVRAKDIDGAGIRNEAVTIRFSYTLPAAGARTFNMILQTSAAGDIYNPLLSVQGVVS